MRVLKIPSLDDINPLDAKQTPHICMLRHALASQPSSSLQTHLSDSLAAGEQGPGISRQQVLGSRSAWPG